METAPTSEPVCRLWCTRCCALQLWSGHRVCQWQKKEEIGIDMSCHDSFLSFRGLGRVKHWPCLDAYLSWHIHSYLGSNHEGYSADKRVGLWRGPVTSTTVQHLLGKASHLPDPSPSQAHKGWSLFIGNRWEKGLGPVPPPQNPTPWPQQAKGQRPLSISNDAHCSFFQL